MKEESGVWVFVSQLPILRDTTNWAASSDKRHRSNQVALSSPLGPLMPVSAAIPVPCPLSPTTQV